MTTIQQALQIATALLEKNSSTARIDAEMLLQQVLQKPRTWLYTWPETCLDPSQLTLFNTLLQKRAAGEPIAYLIEKRAFWTFDLKVTSATLIPRPETEMLIERTLDLLKDKKNISILDAGTGTGAIALALAKERPDWEIIACDISESALAVAKENARLLNIPNVCFYKANWFDGLPSQKKYHAIISNPPYIDPADPHLKEGDLRFEPSIALASENAGYRDLQHIIETARAFLHDHGLLLLEHGYNQREKIASMLTQCGYNDLASWQDYQGLNRISSGIWHS